MPEKDKHSRIVIGLKNIEQYPEFEYLCVASLEEIDDEIYKRERVNSEHRFRFKRLDIDQLEDMTNMLRSNRKPDIYTVQKPDNSN